VVDPGAAPAAVPRRHPRQNLILAVAAGLLAAVVVIVLVVTLRGSDGPPAGSPDAVTDQLAAALRAHDVARARAVACTGQRAQVTRAIGRALPGELESAQRRASAEVQGEVAVDLIALQSATQSGSMTVALRQGADAWCVTSIAVSMRSAG
jgi:hypothetical protein